MYGGELVVSSGRCVRLDSGGERRGVWDKFCLEEPVPTHPIQRGLRHSLLLTSSIVKSTRMRRVDDTCPKYVYIH